MMHGIRHLVMPEENGYVFLGSDDYLWKSSVFEEIMPHMIKAESARHADGVWTGCKSNRK